jgi:predicted permease
LLVLQGTLSVILLVGAGLFVRSLRNVQSLRWGYDVDPVAIAYPNMRGLTLDSVARLQLYDRLLATAKTIPGVKNAALQDAVPYWSTSSTSLYVEGIDTVARLGQFNFNKVSPEYFATIGTRIIRGRGLTRDDVAGAPRAMVVSEAMAKTIWPGKDAIGQCIRVRADTMPCTYVVGIAENIKAGSLTEDPGLYYYLPVAQERRTNGLFIRTRGDASKNQETIRRALQREMPGASYITVTPFSEIIGPQKRSWNLGATMFSAFGVLAVLLAAIGLYSVIAYNVTQRTHEMGVRRALGAQAGDVVQMIVSDGLRLASVGVIVGVGISLWASKWVKPLLFGVSPRDPGVFVFVALVLIAVAVAASWIPALRAARVDPNIALRTE